MYIILVSKLVEEVKRKRYQWCSFLATTWKK